MATVKTLNQSSNQMWENAEVVSGNVWSTAKRGVQLQWSLTLKMMEEKFFRPHLNKHGIPYVSPTWTFSFDKVRDFSGTFCNVMAFSMQHAVSKQFLKRLYCLAETDRLRILSNHRAGFYWLTVFLCTPFFFFCNTRNENWAMKRTSCTSEYLSIKQPLQCLPKSEI